MSELVKRVKKEKEIYDHGVTFSNNYKLILDSINRSPAMQRSRNLTNKLMTCCKDKMVLEIGSSSWLDWVDFKFHSPKKLVAINISETELNRGINRSKDLCLDDKIEFRIMDAHFIEYPNNTFDVVYGASILHHLDIKLAIKEIHRVLKYDGFMVFTEPLIYNPFANLIRFLTPNARTPDEKPLGIRELKIIDDYFNTKYHFYQLVDPFFSMFSYLLFDEIDNYLTRLGDKMDTYIARFPYIKYFYRGVVIYGKKT